MKHTLSSIRSAFCLLLVFTILLGGIYPLIITIISKTLFATKSTGSLIMKDGEVIGSSLLGQEFTEAKYFWGRLSANHYDAMDSAGSNLSQANPKLLEAVNARVEALQKAAPLNKAKIPVDLVTASGSGLDPHISLLAAEYQIDRVAAARNMKPDEIQAFITDNIAEQSELFGTPYVNVLELNLSLDNAGK
jgi:K+-transporting ATPase ATPase C chain